MIEWRLTKSGIYQRSFLRNCCRHTQRERKALCHESDWQQPQATNNRQVRLVPHQSENIPQQRTVDLHRSPLDGAIRRCGRVDERTTSSCQTPETHDLRRVVQNLGIAGEANRSLGRLADQAIHWLFHRPETFFENLKLVSSITHITTSRKSHKKDWMPIESVSPGE